MVQNFQVDLDRLVRLQSPFISPQTTHASFSGVDANIAFSNCPWIIDFGAISRMTCLKNILYLLHLSNNYRPVHIVHKVDSWSLVVSDRVSSCYLLLTLKNVLLVLKSPISLLCIYQLTILIITVM